MPVNAGKRYFWEYCPCRYLPVNATGQPCWVVDLMCHVTISHWVVDLVCHVTYYISQGCMPRMPC